MRESRHWQPPPDCDVSLEEYRQRMGLERSIGTQSPLEKRWCEIWWQHAPDMPIPLPEYEFNSPHTDHRFDFCWPDYWLAVECDGGVNAPGGGSHARDTDRYKLNIAASLGWTVYRFSGAMLMGDKHYCVGIVARTLDARSTWKKQS